MVGVAAGYSRSPILTAAWMHRCGHLNFEADEAQAAMEMTPQPNLVIPLKLSDATSVRQGFRTLGVACETLAAASWLIDLMPGNEEEVIAREEQP